MSNKLLDQSVLKETVEILNNRNIKWWLDHGTLLGFVREGGPIDWDLDFDIGIEEVSKKDLDGLLETLKAYYGSVYYDEIYNSLKITFIENEGVWYIDIAIYKVVGDCLIKRWVDVRRYGWVKRYLIGLVSFLSGNDMSWMSKNIFMRWFKRWSFSLVGALPQPVKSTFKRNVISRLPMKTINTPRRFFLEFEKLVVDGYAFNVPSPVRDYLSFRYGDDWETPIKAWNPVSDDGGVSY